MDFLWGFSILFFFFVFVLLLLELHEDEEKEKNEIFKELFFILSPYGLKFLVVLKIGEQFRALMKKK
jgi:hypothetical protein